MTTKEKIQLIIKKLYELRLLLGEDEVYIYKTTSCHYRISKRDMNQDIKHFEDVLNEEDTPQLLFRDYFEACNMTYKRIRRRKRQ